MLARIRRAIAHLGHQITRKRSGFRLFPVDFSDAEIATYTAVRPYTMTSAERVIALVRSVEYLVRHNIEGAVVECGVWRGGSAMAAAITLIRLGDTSRKICLFDTFAGMTEPSANDVLYSGEHAAQVLGDRSSADESWWCAANVDEVRRNLVACGYPVENLVFVAGDIIETVPESAPERIALLRLDTDWYESTRHELVHLYPRLVHNGVLILDDYGHWQGARRAVDEYFAAHNTRILLARIDYTGRIAIKQDQA
jgi:O-methyltransferase